MKQYKKWVKHLYRTAQECDQKCEQCDFNDSVTKRCSKQLGYKEA